MPLLSNTPSSERKNSFLSTFELGQITEEKNKLFEDLENLKKGLEELEKICSKLQKDTEYQNLLVENQSQIQQKLEKKQNLLAAQSLPQEEINKEIDETKKRITLDFWVKQSLSFVNPSPAAHQVLEKIEYLVTEELGLRWEDLGLEWDQVITLCCNLKEFEEFIKKRKKALKLLESQYQEKINLLTNQISQINQNLGKRSLENEIKGGKFQPVEKFIEEKKLKEKQEYYLNPQQIVPATLSNFFKEREREFIYPLIEEQQNSIREAKDESELEQVVEQIKREHDQKFIRPFIRGGIVVTLVAICFVLVSWWKQFKWWVKLMNWWNKPLLDWIVEEEKED